MAKSYKLVLLSGVNAGTEYPLEKEELYLGRDVNNDITINDSEVSRKHARLLKQGENYTYQDLGSTNGSFIQGQRIEIPVMLLPGTTITIGERVMLSYVVEGADDSATVVVQRQRPQPVAPQVPPAPIAQPPVVKAPPAAPPPAAPIYQPQQPSYAMPPAAPVPAPKNRSKGLVVLLVILAVVLIFCVIPWIILEVTDSYCSVLPWLFNAIQAGACM